MAEYLKIPKTKKVKGLRVVCSICNTQVNDYSRQESSKPGKICIKHGSKQHFVAIAYPKDSKKSLKKQLETRDYEKAIEEAAEFIKQVKRNTYTPFPERGFSSFNLIEDLKKIKMVIESGEKINNSNSITDIVNKIMNDINNLKMIPNINENTNGNGIKKIGDFEIETNPSTLYTILLEEYLKIKREYFNDPKSPRYKAIANILGLFTDFLIRHNVKIDEFSVTDLHKSIVEKFHIALSKTITNRGKEQGNATTNTQVRDLIAFENWIIKEKEIQMFPVFHGLEKKKVSHKNAIISWKNYCKVLEFVNKKIEEAKSMDKPLYKAWAKNGIKLGLETGCRLEEISELKFNNIKELDGKYYIHIKDLKNNRIKRYEKEEEQIEKYIPISEELIKLLEELEWSKYKNTDRYILAPELKSNRVATVKSTLANCFKIAYDSLNEEGKIRFKHLRKTFITGLKRYQVNLLMIHQEEKTAEIHYENKAKLAAELYEWSVFSESEKQLYSKNNPT